MDLNTQLLENAGNLHLQVSRQLLVGREAREGNEGRMLEVGGQPVTERKEGRRGDSAGASGEHKEKLRREDRVLERDHESTPGKCQWECYQTAATLELCQWVATQRK